MSTRPAACGGVLTSSWLGARSMTTRPGWPPNNTRAPAGIRWPVITTVSPPAVPPLLGRADTRPKSAVGGRGAAVVEVVEGGGVVVGVGEGDGTGAGPGKGAGRGAGAVVEVGLGGTVGPGPGPGAGGAGDAGGAPGWGPPDGGGEVGLGDGGAGVGVGPG